MITENMKSDQQLLNKKKKPLAAPKRPGPALTKYDTPHYVPYDFTQNKVAPELFTFERKKGFERFDSYTLFRERGALGIVETRKERGPLT